MKSAALLMLVFAALTGSAGTNLVSNIAVITNWNKEAVTFTRNADGTAHVNDPSGRLIGTAEAKALKVAADAHQTLTEEAGIAAESAMWHWSEFMRTNESSIVYLSMDFSQELPAMASNLVGWVAKSWYDGEVDHYLIWFNKEQDFPPMMDFRFRREGLTYWEYGTWANWEETETVEGVVCRELIVPRRYKDSILKTGSVISFGGREGFDFDPHKVNVEVNGRPTKTMMPRMTNFKTVVWEGTNRVKKAYASGYINIENGAIKGANEDE